MSFFHLFYLSNNFHLIFSDVPAVMQYLGQFPSIAQINSVVLPEVRKKINL